MLPSCHWLPAYSAEFMTASTKVSRVVKQPKSKRTQPRFYNRWCTLYRSSDPPFLIGVVIVVDLVGCLAHQVVGGVGVQAVEQDVVAADVELVADVLGKGGLEHGAGLWGRYSVLS